MKQILVLTDFSRRAERAAALALDIALKEGAEILLHHSSNVLTPVPSEGGLFAYYPDIPGLNEENRVELEKLAARIRREYRQRTHRTAPPIQVSTSPHALTDDIRTLSKNADVWLIVMGGNSRDSRLERFVLGSETRGAIDAATCPVLLVPEYAHLKRIKKIGFATDLNLTDARLISFVAELAGLWRSSIDVIHVGPAAEDPLLEMKHNRCYSRLREAAHYADITFTDLEGKDVAGSIEDYALREGLGLLAVVHRKRSPLSRAFHRSFSKRMIDMHRTPLLVMAGVQEGA